MKPTRRTILRGISAAAVLPACRSKPDDSAEPDTGEAPPEGAPERSPEPDLWAPDATLDEAAFPFGVQAGDPTLDGAVLSVWSSEPVLGFMLAQGTKSGWISPEPAPEIDTRALVPVDGRTQLTLSGLQPDTVYAVCFASEDLSRVSRVTRFRTALAEEGWRVLHVAATCCLGKPGRPWPSMAYAAAADPDVFLLLGDTVYATGAETTDEFLEFYKASLPLEGLAEASAHSAMVAIWDDHEVANNFAGGTTDPDLLASALEAFRAVLPHRRGAGPTGLWRQLSWGRVADLFVLDCRGERDGEDQYISVEQMDWLKAGLKASTARFKLIMSSVPITDYSAMIGEALAVDRWQGYPAQRSEILGHIEEESIEGVLWLTGDFHMGVLSRIDPVGGIAQDRWEVMVGAAGSTKNLLPALYESTDQFPVIFDDWNSVLLRLDPGLGEITVTYLGNAGEVIAERVLGL
jgi:alkaline phosphatase D